MGTGAAFWSGIVAGLAVAMPLGAIGVLLVQEGALRGTRRALPGAAAVASVDTLYCALAALAGGAAAPRIAAWRPWPALVGGVALLLVAAVGLRRGLVVRAGEAVADEAEPAPGSRRYLVFLGLTAINPATLVYFAALMSGLTGLAGRPVTVAVFVAAVGVASLGWQVALVTLGGVLHRRIGERARRATVLVGGAAVAALGVAMLVRGLR